MNALGDLPLTSAKADATVEAITGMLDFAKLWLSSVGAIVVLTMSASYLAKDRISSLSTLEKGILLVAFLCELFELYVVSRLVDNLFICQTAYRIYLKTPVGDPSLPEIIVHIDSGRARVTGSANIGMIVGLFILLFLLYAYFLIVFSG